jgi:hypothetical protein
MLSGKRAIDRNRPTGEQNLVDWAKRFLTSKRKILEVFDARIEGQYSFGVALKAANLAIHCLSVEPRFRPNMEKVVRILEQLQDSNGIGGSRNEIRQNSTRNSRNGPKHRKRSVNGAYNEKAAPSPGPSASPLHKSNIKEENSFDT